MKKINKNYCMKFLLKSNEKQLDGKENKFWENR